MTHEVDLAGHGFFAHLRGRLIRIRDLDVPTLALLGTSWGTLIAAIVLGIGVRVEAAAKLLALTLPLLGWTLLFVATANAKRPRTRWFFAICLLYGLVTMFPEPMQYNVIALDRSWIAQALLYPLTAGLQVLAIATLMVVFGYFATRGVFVMFGLFNRLFSRYAFAQRFVNWVRRQREGVDRFEVPITLVLTTATTIAIFTAWAATASSMGAERYVQYELANLSLMLIPVLLVAGSDIAEIAELGGDIAIGRHWAARPNRLVVIGIGLCGGLLIVAAIALPRTAWLLVPLRIAGITLPRAAWLLALFGVVWIGGLLASARRSRSPDDESAKHVEEVRVPVRTLVAVGMAFTVIDLLALYGPAYFAANPPLLINGAAGVPSTVVKRPVNWARVEPAREGETNVAAYLLSPPWRSFVFEPAREGETDVATADGVVISRFVEQTWMAHFNEISPSDMIKERPPGDEVTRAELRIGPCDGGADASWTREHDVVDVDVHRVERTWFRHAVGCEWRMIEFASSPEEASRLRERFDAVRASWHVVEPDHFAEITLACGFVVILAGVLLRRPKKLLRWLLPTQTARMYVLIFVACGLLGVLISVFRERFGLKAGEESPMLAVLVTVLIGVAVVMLAVAVLTLRTSTHERCVALLSALVPLTGALILLAFFTAAYSWAAHSQKPGVVQALVIVVAISWDLLTSGEAFTNNDTPGLPRPSRVLLFAAFVVFVAGAITNFADFRIFNGPKVGFESEAWTLEGIVRLGIPYLLTVFAMRAANKAA